MKKYYILTIFGIMSLLMTGCSLEMQPISEIGEGSYYKNASEINAAVVACYNGLQAPMSEEWVLTELRSDNTRPYNTVSTSTSNLLLFEFDQSKISATNSHIYDYWVAVYNEIARCNTVLQHLNVIDEGETRDHYEGEARLLRAYQYFNLVRLFGPVFLITDRITADEAKSTQRITVGGGEANILFRVNGSLLIAEITKTSRDGKVTLINSVGESTSASDFEITYSTPSFNDLPSEASVYSNILVNGTNLNFVDSIMIAGIKSEIISQTQTEIVFQVPFYDSEDPTNLEMDYYNGTAEKRVLLWDQGFVVTKKKPLITNVPTSVTKYTPVLIEGENLDLFDAFYVGSLKLSINHHIYHNYFGPRPALGSNGGETLRIGTSFVSKRNSRTLVEENLFEKCSGEVEIISIKSCENTIKNNTFVACEGGLTLRHGDRNHVIGNIIDGQNHPATGGIRIINAGHVVENNIILTASENGLRDAVKKAQSGDTITLKPGEYVNTKRIKIDKNLTIRSLASQTTQDIDKNTQLVFGGSDSTIVGFEIQDYAVDYRRLGMDESTIGGSLVFTKCILRSVDHPTSLLHYQGIKKVKIEFIR